MEKLILKIEKPCTENFNNFSKTANGGFCNSCKKNVVDFTKMNNNEILNYFNKNETNTCGLFLKSQLKIYSRDTTLAKSHKSISFISSVFGISLLSFLSISNGFSQVKTIKNEFVKVEPTKNSDKVEANNSAFIVEGVISDEFGPLPGANVYLKNFDISTQTDFDGKFTFPKPLKIGDVLIVTYIGFKEKEIIVSNKNKSSIINYELFVSEQIMMGDVSTNKVYKTKRTFFQKIKSFFTNE